MIMRSQAGDKLMSLTDVSEMLGIRHSCVVPPAAQWRRANWLPRRRQPRYRSEAVAAVWAEGRQALTQDHERSVGASGRSSIASLGPASSTRSVRTLILGCITCGPTAPCGASFERLALL